MKKTYLAAACVVLAGAVTLAGCSIADIMHSYSSDEVFPYDVATEHGEDGSPESWLSSLQTPTTELRRLYEEAKNQEDGGFTGTFYEFLQEFGVEDGSLAVQTGMRSVVRVNCAIAGTVNYSLGSGVIYSLDKTEGDALIVTNYHVVYNKKGTGREKVPYVSDDIDVYLYGAEVSSRAIEATFLGGAMEYDIAVLKVENSPYLKETAENKVYATEAVARDSASVTLGDRVYAIGNAGGHGLSAVEGVVSLESETATFAAVDGNGTMTLPEIRTDAALNPGNSGGGLFNAAGELLGIVNGRAENNMVGIGYAIPSNIALAVAQNVIDTCAKSPNAHCGALATLGITVSVADSRGVYDEETGKIYIEQQITIEGVSSDSAAKRAGFAGGDTLISATLRSHRGGEAYERKVYLTDERRLTELLLEARLGDTMQFELRRGGETKTLSVTFTADDFRTLA